MSISLIVGLANPGKEYAATRHNAGAWWVQALCNLYNLKFQTHTKTQTQIAEGNLQGIKFRCAIPTTYMNHSGQALAKVAQYFDVPADEILIAHDELDFAPGIIRIKFGGGHAGHNGLRDIIPALGTDKFHRLRIGIGHPGSKDQVSDYVVGVPSKHDQKLIDTAIQNSLSLFPAILSADWHTVMNQLHQV